MTEESRPPVDLRPDAIADNLIAAVSWILRDVRHREGER
jgi:hypothetical protein